MKRCIVFIDDSPMTRDLAAVALSDTGCEVQTCPDAEAGLRAVQAKGPALAAVVVDTHLPGANVAHLVASVRAMAPDIPLIFLLDCGPRPPDTQLARQYSASTLAKPFTPQELLEVTQAALRQQGGGTPACSEGSRSASGSVRTSSP